MFNTLLTQLKNSNAWIFNVCVWTTEYFWFIVVLALSYNTNCDHLLWQCVGERQTDRIYFIDDCDAKYCEFRYVWSKSFNRISQFCWFNISIHSQYISIECLNSFVHICFWIGRHPHRIVLFLIIKNKLIYVYIYLYGFLPLLLQLHTISSLHSAYTESLFWFHSIRATCEFLFHMLSWLQVDHSTRTQIRYLGERLGIR